MVLSLEALEEPEVTCLCSEAPPPPRWAWASGGALRPWHKPALGTVIPVGLTTRGQCCPQVCLGGGLSMLYSNSKHTPRGLEQTGISGLA